MKWRMHGANPEKLYLQFGIPMPKDVIDFSDNGNAIKKDSALNLNYEAYFDQYPDDEANELRQLIAKRENLSVDHILFSNGTNELIYILASYYQGKKVAILHPTYSEYEKALKAYHVNIEYIFDFSEVKKEHAALIVCNPNNPTGRYFDNEIMVNLCNQLALLDIDLIIDEAYIDFMSSPHQTLNIKSFKHVYILRSLTKFYHLSGLRIGYVLSHEENIEKLKNRQPTWSVNSIAQIVSLSYLNDLKFIQKTKSFYYIFMIFLLGCISGLLVIGLAKDIGVDIVKLDPLIAANAVAIIALFNASGRITWGYLTDKINVFKVILSMFFITTICMAITRTTIL